MKNFKNCKTYIINVKRPPGGKSYKEYTWSQVLEAFNAPEDISDIDELVHWLESDGMVCEYDIEVWQEYDENGMIK